MACSTNAQFKNRNMPGDRATQFENVSFNHSHTGMAKYAPSCCHHSSLMSGWADSKGYTVSVSNLR